MEVPPQVLPVSRTCIKNVPSTLKGDSSRKTAHIYSSVIKHIQHSPEHFQISCCRQSKHAHTFSALQINIYVCMDLRYTVNSIPLSENRERGRGQTGTQFSYSFYCGWRTHMSLCVPSPIFISHTHPLSIHARVLSLSLPRAPTSVSLAISGVQQQQMSRKCEGRAMMERARERR